MKEILARVIAWYDENRKPLPWRDAPTPYHVWVSEIMLQQTRIEAVIPYYLRFVEELPTPAALAAVEDDRLMKLWEGLGYYSRARHLKEAACRMVERYGGEVPRTAEQLRELPGIGAYTAGAIASIAFGEPEPAVDGNVLRVMSRVLAQPDDITLQKTRRAMEDRLRAAYPEGREAGLLTEGLMELGETICLPNGVPLCQRCPVRELCLAYREDEVDRYPVRAEKKARRVEERTVLLLRQGGRYAIRRRNEAGLLRGMWEFPNALGILTEAETAEWVKSRGLHPVSVWALPSARHIFTHVEWHMIGYEVELSPETEETRNALSGTAGAGADELIWERAETIRRLYAIPTAFRAFSERMRDDDEAET